MYFSSLLLFIEFLQLSHGYMLWNPHQIDYERFKQAAYEAISAEAKVNCIKLMDFTYYVPSWGGGVFYHWKRPMITGGPWGYNDKNLIIIRRLLLYKIIQLISGYRETRYVALESPFIYNS
jgi:hypothetical protein